MVRVLFADGGTLEQLRATLDGVAAAASDGIVELRAMIDTSLAGLYEFAGRLPINALALRFQLDHEQLLVDWTRWARSQTAAWRSPTDAGGWDWQSALV